jgi:hypothetical protein
MVSASRPPPRLAQCRFTKVILVKLPTLLLVTGSVRGEQPVPSRVNRTYWERNSDHARCRAAQAALLMMIKLSYHSFLPQSTTSGKFED